MIDRLLQHAHAAAQDRSQRPPARKSQDDFKDWLQAESNSGAGEPRARDPGDVTSANESSPPPSALPTDESSDHLKGLPESIAAASSDGELLEGQSSDAMQVKLQFLGGDGRLEAVAVPLRLAATGRMAWATTQARGLDSATAVAGLMSARVNDAAASKLQLMAPTAGAEVPVGARAGQSPLMHGMTAAQSAHIAGGDTETSSSRAWLAAAAESWLERLLRWTHRHGHDPVAWVRDYRLDENGARDLTRSLQSRARAEGFALARIVVNGRELWRAPSYSHSSETL